MRQLLCIWTAFLGLTACNNSTTETEDNGVTKFSDTISAQHKTFYLAYGFGGLGSNQFQKFYPVVHIYGETLEYMIQRKNGKYSISKPFNDTIWEQDTVTYKLKMRPASVDSILALVNPITDTTIFESNPGIMSGGIHFLTVALGTDSVQYHLMNTFDWTALKITDIINTYLPADNKIWVTAQLIKDSEEWWKNFRSDTTDKKKKKEK